ncbi:MAG TPA: ABC transporter ATP-binding protein [Mycobacteriales bacterium]|nr:ABC transporter ATP-binding protein [Mycobacteriales bacterium]
MLLQVEGLRVAYGRIEALHGIDLEVAEGEIVTLLGANGAGKTTTLRTISGLLPPTAGSVTFDGQRISGRPAHEIVAAGIGHVPEGRRVFPRMTVVENLQIGAYQRRGDLTEDMDRVFSLFPVLQERRTQTGGTLSGGEQQMLAIGRALMGRPRLLLLDEPSMGLAPMIVAKIFEILREINSQGTTILLVEQNAAQALRLAGRGYVLETGAIALADRAESLLADDRVRSAYLGESVA